MKLKMYVLIAFAAVFFSACSKDDEEKSESEQSFVFKAGMDHEGIVLIDGVEKEYVKEIFEEFGTEDRSALFPIAQTHRIDGKQVADGASPQNRFRSINRKGLRLLLRKYLEYKKVDATNLPIDKDELTQELRIHYSDLRDFLEQTQIDQGILVSLSKLSATNPFSYVDDLSLRSASMEKMTMNDRILTIEDGLVNRTDMKPIQTRSVTGVIEGIATGMSIVKKALTLILRLIDNACPMVDASSSFASYLHPDDLSPQNYPTSNKVSRTSKYTVQHRSWGSTWSQASYMITVDYHGENKKLLANSDRNRYYVPSIAFLITDIVCLASNHVDAQCTMGNTEVTEQPSSIESGKSTIVIPCRVEINYGNDSKKKVNYHYYHNFTIYGDKGFVDGDYGTPQ